MFKQQAAPLPPLQGPPPKVQAAPVPHALEAVHRPAGKRYNQPCGPPPPRPQAANIVDLSQPAENPCLLGPDLLAIAVDTGILQVATNINSVQQQLQEDLIKYTMELQDFYEDDLSQYTSDDVKTANVSELHSLDKKNIYGESGHRLFSQQNNIDTSSRLDGSSDLDLRPPQLMTSMTLQDLSRQESLPRDTANTSRTTSSKHSPQHRQVHP